MFIYGGSSLVTSGKRKAKVLSAFFISVFTDRVFAWALPPPSLLRKERDGGQ